MAAPIPGEPVVEPSELPSGQALMVSHFGAYASLPQAWGRLSAAAGERGFRPS